jgi:hypothetical protein
LIGAKHLGEIIAQRNRPCLGIGLPITHKIPAMPSSKSVSPSRLRRCEPY